MLILLLKENILFFLFNDKLQVGMYFLYTCVEETINNTNSTLLIFKYQFTPDTNPIWVMYVIRIIFNNWFEKYNPHFTAELNLSNRIKWIESEI